MPGTNGNGWRTSTWRRPLKAAQSAPVAKRGDIWLLGDHRLMCGDSTSPDDVARLMNGQKASLLATDPPYLVDYTGGNHPPVKATTKPRPGTSTGMSIKTRKPQWSSTLSSWRSDFSTSNQLSHLPVACPPAAGTGGAGLDGLRAAGTPADHLGQSPRRLNSLPLPVDPRALLLRLGEGQAADQRNHRPMSARSGSWTSREAP